MQTTQFDRDGQARWYANQHLRTDPGIREVHYLGGGAPDREIRLIEVNELMPSMRDDSIEPLDFGVDRDSELQHKLVIVDVTPSQWDRIRLNQIPLPEGWSLDGSTMFPRRLP